MSRIIEYDEVSSVGSDDYLIVDNVSSGTKKVRGTNLFSVIERELENGEYRLNSGTLLRGLYPVQSGVIAANASSRMVVYPVKENTTYYVTWKDGSSAYRTAFGDSAPGEITEGTPIFNFVDNRKTSHDRYPVKNSTHNFLYVYIGTSAAATLDAVEVSSDIFSFKNYMASDGESW